MCLQLLLKYPAPKEPHGPHTFVDDALYLREHLTPSGGASLIMKYTGKMPTVSSSPEASRAGTPSLRGFNSFRQKGLVSRSPLPSPSRFIAQQGGMEAIFQGAAKGAKGVLERGEKLGINQAVRDAVGEIRRNLNEARQPVRSLQQISSEEGAAQGLAALERRNRGLAAMLEETVSNLKAVSASNLDDKSKSLELIEIAAAKVQFVKMYLEDSSMEVVPALDSPPPEEMPKEVVVAETTLVQPAPTVLAPVEAGLSALELTDPDMKTKKDKSPPPASSDMMDTSADEVASDSLSVPSAPEKRPVLAVPARSTLAQSSFSWMLEPDESGPSKSITASAKSPPSQHKKRISNSASREKNAFLFGEATEGRNPVNDGDIFGLEPMGKSKKTPLS